MKVDTEQQTYQDFRSVLTERTSKVIAWGGSGLIAAAGLPTSADLREALLSSFRDTDLLGEDLGDA